MPSDRPSAFFGVRAATSGRSALRGVQRVRPLLSRVAGQRSALQPLHRASAHAHPGQAHTGRSACRPGALPQTTCQRSESRPSWRRTSRSRCRAWHASRATTRPAARLTNLPACNAPHVTCKSASTHVGCRTLHAAHRQPYGAPCLPCAGRRLCAACKALGADSLQPSHGPDARARLLAAGLAADVGESCRNAADGDGACGPCRCQPTTTRRWRCSE